MKREPFIGAILLAAFLAGCTLQREETTEIGGTFEEWKEKLRTDPEALQKAEECKEAIKKNAASCVQHEGFTLTNVMEITDFINEPYAFQENLHGGCNSSEAIGQIHEPEVTTILYGTGGNSSYQVVCDAVCVWWKCKPDTSLPPPPPEKGDLSLTAECSLANTITKGEITTYYFEVVAKGTASGPISTKLNVDAYVARTNVQLWTCKNYFETGQYMVGGFSGVSWSGTEEFMANCPSEMVREFARKAGDSKQTSWQYAWPYDYQDAYSYASEDDDVLVKAWISMPDGSSKIERVTVTCQRS